MGPDRVEEVDVSPVMLRERVSNAGSQVWYRA